MSPPSKSNLVLLVYHTQVLLGRFNYHIDPWTIIVVVVTVILLYIVSFSRSRMLVQRIWMCRGSHGVVLLVGQQPVRDCQCRQQTKDQHVRCKRLVNNTNSNVQARLGLARPDEGLRKSKPEPQARGHHRRIP